MHYNVRCMQQIVSITNARNNLSELVNKVSSQDLEVVIVRDSEPEVIISSYEKAVRNKQLEDELWKLKWERLLKETRKAGQRWAKKNNIDLKRASEEELYDIIDQVRKGTFKSRS